MSLFSSIGQPIEKPGRRSTNPMAGFGVSIARLGINDDPPTIAATHTAAFGVPAQSFMVGPGNAPYTGFKKIFGEGEPIDPQSLKTTIGVIVTPVRAERHGNASVTSIIARPEFKDLTVEELRIADYEIMQHGLLPEETQVLLKNNIEKLEAETGSEVKLPPNFVISGGRKARPRKKVVKISENVAAGDEDEYISHIKKLYLNKTFSDVTFILSGEEVPAHRNVVAMRCKFFENMFTSGMTEANASKIEINDIKPSTFKLLLAFIYCNEFELTEDLAVDLLKVSDKYSFLELKDVCETFLGEHLTIDNFVEIANIAEQFEGFKLRESIIDFVIKNRREIEKKESPGRLSKELLWDIVFKLDVQPIWKLSKN